LAGARLATTAADLREAEMPLRAGAFFADVAAFGRPVLCEARDGLGLPKGRARGGLVDFAITMSRDPFSARQSTLGMAPQPFKGRKIVPVARRKRRLCRRVTVLALPPG
jgi:hypothetical protein